MAAVPTYQDINRKRAETAAMQAQAEQKASVANDPVVMGTPNPVLADYLGNNSRQQGLIPAQTNPIEYGLTMVDAAMRGEVPIEAVLADGNVPEQIKTELVNTANRGLGQLG